jgi:hypothetical protein
MDVKQMTIEDFLLARIAEDEASARKAAGEGIGPEWSVDTDYGPAVVSGKWGTDHDTFDWHVCFAEGSPGAGQAAHIANHDPARVLRECDAKRRIVEEHTQEPVIPGWSERGETYACRVCRHQFAYEEVVRTGDVPCATLRLMAAIYADHSDYREEWKP